MKKGIYLLTLLTLALMPVLALAQGGEVSASGGYGESFVSLTAVAGLVLAVTEVFANLFKIPEGAEMEILWLKLKTVQFVALLVGVAVGIFGFLFDLGMFVDFLWYQSAAIGLGAAFLANGFANTKIVKGVLKLIGIYLRASK